MYYLSQNVTLIAAVLTYMRDSNIYHIVQLHTSIYYAGASRQYFVHFHFQCAFGATGSDAWPLKRKTIENLHSFD